MKGVSRTTDSAGRERPDAFDAGDTPGARQLGAGYLDQVTPAHVKAALAAKAATLNSAPMQSTSVVIQTAEEIEAAKAAEKPPKPARERRRAQLRLRVSEPVAEAEDEAIELGAVAYGRI